MTPEELHFPGDGCAPGSRVLSRGFFLSQRAIRAFGDLIDEKKLHLFVLELQEGAKPVDILNGSKLAASPGFGGVFTEAGAQSLQAVWTPDSKQVVTASTDPGKRLLPGNRGAVMPIIILGDLTSPRGKRSSNP